MNDECCISRTLIGDDRVDKPDGGFIVDVLVSVDLLLLVCPVGELLGVRPHRNLRRNVDQAEVSGLGLPGVTLLSVHKTQLEERVIVARNVILRPRCEFFVRRHERRRDIVREQQCLRVDVEELEHVVVSNDTSTSGLGESLGRNNLPVVVGVIVSVTGDLLTLATDTTIVVLKRILVRVRVQEYAGILVPDRNGVVVADLCCSCNVFSVAIHSLNEELTVAVQQKFVTAQRLLERGAHEGVAGTGVGEKGKMDPEDGKVEEQREHNESDSSCSKLFPEVLLGGCQHGFRTQ